MKFSFLVPTYKTDFLKEALESMLNQSFRDFEIIISDDCSPNDIKAFVDMYAKIKITYSYTEANLGAENLAKHWNRLLSLATGDYIIMASDDDVYEYDFLERVNDLILKYPAVNIIRARVRNINELGETIWEDPFYPEYQDEFSAITSYSTVCVGNYIFKTKRLKEKGGFVDFPYAMGSDTATAIIMSENGMTNTSEILFNYRISEKQISHISKNKIVDKKKLEGAILFHTWLHSYINDLKYEANYWNKVQMNNYLNKHVYNGIIHTARLYCWTLNIFEFITILR